MGLLKALLEAMKWVLVALILGVGITVGSGNAEPYVSPSAIPGGPEATFAGMFVGVVAVVLVVGQLQEVIRGDEWEAAGRHAGLQPEGNGGLRSLPDVSGTVDGVAVTARTEKHTVNTGGEGGSTTVRYTLVEAELPGPADDGVIVGRTGDGRMRAERGEVDVDDVVEHLSADEGLVTAETGDLSAVGTSEPAVQAVINGPAGKATRSLEKLDLAHVGDAAAVVASYAETQNEELEDSVFEFPVERLADPVPGDAATVTIETKDLVLNVEEFRRLVVAVVAIADAFAEATVRASAHQ